MSLEPAPGGSNLTFQKNREDFTEKTSVTQPRKGLEGRGAFFVPPGAKNGAKRNHAKPGFRHFVPEMRPNFLKNLRNVKLLPGPQGYFTFSACRAIIYQ
jgi:hypothetical protein